jgi:hypothetical protein
MKVFQAEIPSPKLAATNDDGRLRRGDPVKGAQPADPAAVGGFGGRTAADNQERSKLHAIIFKTRSRSLGALA